MHELLLYYYGRVKPRWDVMCFFLLHGKWRAMVVAHCTAGGGFRGGDNFVAVHTGDVT